MAVRRTSFIFIRPSYIIRSRAVSQGLLGGNRFWQVVAAIVFGRSILKRTLGKHSELLARDVLMPGESLTVHAIAPPPRGRRARRAQS